MSTMGAAPTSPSNHPQAEGPLLVAQLRPALVRYFRRKTGSDAEAEDLAQDVLLRVLTRERWASPEEAKGYVFRAAVNRWNDRCRRLKVRGPALSWDDAVVPRAPAEEAPELWLDRQQEFRRLLLALDSLNPRTRAILMLVKLEQVKIATVADTLGISVSAVNKHLARGLARLAEMREPKDASP